MAEIVSSRGTPAITKGTSMTTKLCVRTTPEMEMMPTIRPRSKAPESPMKIEAGKKLNRKNAKHTAMSATQANASVALPRIITRYKRLADTMAMMPVAKPSNPSIRFVMLTNTTR